MDSRILKSIEGTHKAQEERREKIPPWSHSFINTYELCHLKAYRTYIKKDIEFIPSTESAYGNQVHRAAELRLASRVRLPVEHKGLERYIIPIETFPGEEKHYEWKLGIKEDGSACSYWDNEVWGRGVIDICLIQSDVGAIFDWKTGKRREDPSELELHAILLKAHRPNLTKITGRYLWLKSNTLGTAYDLSDTPVKLAYVRDVMERVKQNFRGGTWQANENVLCSYCDVRDCPYNRKEK